jgi:hypothetical protein
MSETEENTSTTSQEEIKEVGGEVIDQKDDLIKIGPRDTLVYPNNQNLPQATTPADLVKYAMETKADLTQIRELMALQKEWEAEQARKAYNLAMAGFKSEHIEVIKDKHVNYTTSKGTVSYDHASLYGMVKAAVERMGQYGLSHRWDVDQSEPPLIKVTCIVTHQLGHSESITLSAGKDDTGNKNSIQQVASTITYLERYSFGAIMGLAARDQMDDDGRSSDNTFDSEPASELNPRFADLVFNLELIAGSDGFNGLQKSWGALSNEERTIVGADFGRIKKIATDKDAQQ